MNNLAASAPSAPSARHILFDARSNTQLPLSPGSMKVASLSVPLIPRISRYTRWQVIWWVKTGQTWPTIIEVIHPADQKGTRGKGRAHYPPLSKGNGPLRKCPRADGKCKAVDER